MSGFEALNVFLNGYETFLIVGAGIIALWIVKKAFFSK